MRYLFARFWNWLNGVKPASSFNRWQLAEEPARPLRPAFQPLPTPPPEGTLPLGAKFRPPTTDFSPTIGQMQELERLLESIPSLPQGAMQVVAELDSPEACAASVARAIAREPVMAASVVRLSNSTAMGLRREITSVSEAVAYLGFSTTKALFLKLNLEALLPKSQAEGGFDIGKLWIHSVTVAQVAEEIARRASGADPSLALTAGLLHDIGKFVINGRFEDVVGELWNPDGDPNLGLLDRERRLFGADHAMIGAMLATDWKLPNDLVQIIRLHHSPKAQSADLRPEVRRALLSVYVANQLVKFRHVYCQDMEIDQIPELVLTELKLADWIALRSDQKIQSIIDRALMLNGGSSEAGQIAA